jgi:DNA (cytosine-5)-methyltransferase 1
LANLTVGSLFAGIGGFDLAAERAGLEVKWQVEIDDFCNRVLEKHWPHVRRYRDVRTVGPELERVDVICGGFPCQPVSLAGARRAQSDERWLWPQFARLVRELRPHYVVVENVPGLLTAGFSDVLGDLAALGMDAEWESIPARAVGAKHKRERVWVVAYPSGSRLEERGVFTRRRGVTRIAPTREDIVLASDVPDADGGRCQERPQLHGAAAQDTADGDSCWGHLDGCRCAAWWATEPDVGRVAHGVPKRVDRLRGLGNSIVPQVAEWIFRRIIDAERRGAISESQHGLSKPSNSEGLKGCVSMKNPETTARVQEIRDKAEACELVYLTALAEQVVKEDVPWLLAELAASQARAAALEQELREMKAQGSLAAGANAQVCASS